MIESAPPADRTRAAGSPRPNRLSRRAVPRKQAAPATSIEDALLAAATSDLSDEAAGKAFREIAVRACHAAGCCSLRPSATGRWEIDAATRIGRLPKTENAADALAPRCDEVTGSGAFLSVKVDELDGLPGLLAAVPGCSDVLLIILPTESSLETAAPALRRVLTYQQIRHQRLSVEDAHWQKDALASILELVARAGASRSVRQATELIANEFVRHLGCEKVAVATGTGGRSLRIRAISGVGKPDRSSETHRAFRDAMLEAERRPEPGVWPAPDADAHYLLLAHEQLAGVTRDEAVFCQTLTASDGTEVGAWAFTGPRLLIHSDRFARFVTSASDILADSLRLVERAQGSRLKRAAAWLRQKTTSFTRLMIPLGVVGLGLLMTVPVTYRVRCQCTTEPVSRRYAVAPFDGLIVAGFVEPGDRVSAGDPLAEIDGRTIRWELSGLTAEREQATRQREMSLAEGNIPDTFLAELEGERLTAEQNVLQFKRDNLLVRSPIDGVVLSGSLERAEAASITTGQVLFEIGPISPMKLEIAVPAEDIPQVRAGQPVTVWVEGLEEAPIEGRLQRIHPRSEVREAANVFIAEVEVDNAEETLRPGMRGQVRIDGEQRSLGWTLFHKPMDWARSRLTLW